MAITNKETMKKSSSAKPTFKSETKTVPNSAPKPVPKPKDAIDHATGQISPTIDFISKNWKPLIMNYFKAGLASSLSSIILLIIFSLSIIITLGLIVGGSPLLSDLFSTNWASAAVKIIQYLSNNLYAMIGVVLATIIAYVLVIWIASCFTLSVFNITKEQAEGTYSGIWANANRIKMPVLGCLFLTFAIAILFFAIPVALVIFAASVNEILFIFLIVLLIIYYIVFIILYVILTQFWLWELLVARRGLIESLKESVSLVQKNVIGVLIYNLFLFVAYIVLIILFIPISLLLSGADFLVRWMVDSFANSFIASIFVMVFFMILSMLLSLLQRAVVDLVVMPYGYSFWSAIRSLGKKPME